MLCCVLWSNWDLMHSALSPPWTPFGPCSTKLGVSSFLCCFPIYSQAFVIRFEHVKQLCWEGYTRTGETDPFLFCQSRIFALSTNIEWGTFCSPVLPFNKYVFAAGCVKCTCTSCVMLSSPAVTFHYQIDWNCSTSVHSDCSGRRYIPQWDPCAAA